MVAVIKLLLFWINTQRVLTELRENYATFSNSWKFEINNRLFCLWFQPVAYSDVNATCSNELMDTFRPVDEEELKVMLAAFSTMTTIRGLAFWVQTNQGLDADGLKQLAKGPSISDDILPAPHTQSSCLVATMGTRIDGRELFHLSEQDCTAQAAVLCEKSNRRRTLVTPLTFPTAVTWTINFFHHAHDLRLYPSIIYPHQLTISSTENIPLSHFHLDGSIGNTIPSTALWGDQNVYGNSRSKILSRSVENDEDILSTDFDYDQIKRTLSVVNSNSAILEKSYSFDIIAIEPRIPVFEIDPWPIKNLEPTRTVFRVSTASSFDRSRHQSRTISKISQTSFQLSATMTSTVQIHDDNNGHYDDGSDDTGQQSTFTRPVDILFTPTYFATRKLIPETKKYFKTMDDTLASIVYLSEETSGTNDYAASNSLEETYNTDGFAPSYVLEETYNTDGFAPSYVLEETYNTDGFAPSYVLEETYDTGGFAPSYILEETYNTDEFAPSNSLEGTDNTHQYVASNLLGETYDKDEFATSYLEEVDYYYDSQEYATWLSYEEISFSTPTRSIVEDNFNFTEYSTSETNSLASTPQITSPESNTTKPLTNYTSISTSTSSKQTPELKRKVSCPCKCPETMVKVGNISNEQLTEITDGIQRKLTVNTQKLSATIRKKISAKDARDSSRFAGLIGIGFVSVLFGAIVLLDLTQGLFVFSGRLRVHFNNKCV